MKIFLVRSELAKQSSIATETRAALSRCEEALERAKASALSAPVQQPQAISQSRFAAELTSVRSELAVEARSAIEAHFAYALESRP